MAQNHKFRNKKKRIKVFLYKHLKLLLIRAGVFKGITMTAEKAHNKNITKIVGLEQFGFDLEELSNKFQLKFACSVSTHELPGKNINCKVIEIFINFFCSVFFFFFF